MKYDNLKFSWQNEKNSLLKMLKKLQKSSSQRTKTVNVLASKDKKKLSNFLERNKVVIHILCCSLLSVIIASSVTKTRLNLNITNHRYQINTSQFSLSEYRLQTKQVRPSYISAWES